MEAPSLPTEQFTTKSLYTITGAAAAVWLFGAVLYTVLGDKVDEVVYRGIGFGLSILIAIGMLVEKKKFGVKYWLLAIPNSALIFVNASGYNAVNNGSIGTPGVEKKNEAMIPTFNKPALQQANFLPFFKDVAWWPDPKLNQRLEQLEKVNDSLVIENKTIKNKIADNSGDNADKQKITFLEDQVKLLQQENAALKSGNNDTEFTSAIAGLKKDISDKNNQLRTCNNDLQKTKSELATVTNQLNNCLSETNPNDALNNRITSLTNQLAQTKKELSDCESKLKNCNSRVGDPDGSPVVLDLNDKIRKLQGELTNAKNELDKCQTALAQANNRSSNDQTALINDLRSKLNGCNGELEKCSSELRKYQSYYKNCAGQIGMVRDSLNRCLNPKQIIKTQLPKGQ